MLNVNEFGPHDAPCLLLVHGLFGSARNLRVIAKRLAKTRRVIVVDQRNHGDSPWFDSNSYPDMAKDLAEVIRQLGCETADVMGHSMGGKAAMVLALNEPALIRRLLVADIAPVAYTHSQSRNIDAMRAVDTQIIETRSDLVAQLSKNITDPALVSFFAQSFDVAEKRWKLNLDVLDREMDKIIGFPEMSGRFDGPVLFLSGGQSDYVQREHRAGIKQLFPNARFAKLPEAGHWLHADDPNGFIKSAEVWFGRGE